jgi:hypothetical protein
MSRPSRSSLAADLLLHRLAQLAKAVPQLPIRSPEPCLDRLAYARKRGRAWARSRCPSSVRRTRYDLRSSGFGIRSACPRASSRPTRKSTVESGISTRAAKPVGVHGPSAPIITYIG